LKIDPSLNHGRWTASEDQAFEEAVQYYSAKNWQEISEYIGSRTAFQCKERYELKYVNPDKYKNWTIEEDKKLLDLVDEYGGQWARIAEFEFPNRTDHSCLFRYSKLMRWKRQNDWFDSQPDTIQEFILFLFKKRKPRQEEEVKVYTAKGELIPTMPKLGSGTGFLASIIDKIFEKKDLVDEFIRKKRDGQLSLTLLAKIGIYTPVINNLIAKYKKYHLRQAMEIEKKLLGDGEEIVESATPGKKRGRKPKPKIESEPTSSKLAEESLDNGRPKMMKSTNRLESERIKRKYTKKKALKINKILPPSEPEQPTRNDINFYLKKKLGEIKPATLKNKKFVSQIDSNSNIEELFAKKQTQKGKLCFDSLFFLIL
jgi:hypothetical protein